MNANDVRSLVTDQLIPLLAAFRAAGIDVSYQRALRLVKDGAQGIRLKALKVGGRWYSTPDAVRDLIACTTDRALSREPSRNSAAATHVGAGARYLRAVGLDQHSLAVQSSADDQARGLGRSRRG